MSEFGLEDGASRLMRNVFKKHPNITEVRVFGSRAKGNFRRESDVDFALFGEVDSGSGRAGGIGRSMHGGLLS